MLLTVIEAIGEMRPSAHVQSFRDPLQGYCGFNTQAARKRHFLRISFLASLKFRFGPQFRFAKLAEFPAERELAFPPVTSVNHGVDLGVFKKWMNGKRNFGLRPAFGIKCLDQYLIMGGFV